MLFCIGVSDVYYTDVNLFESQKRTDVILDNLACMFNIPRNSLHIVKASFSSFICMFQIKLSE
jgi:DNA topoisomerase VI subunit A